GRKQVCDPPGLRDRRRDGRAGDRGCAARRARLAAFGRRDADGGLSSGRCTCSPFVPASGDPAQESIAATVGWVERSETHASKGDGFRNISTHPTAAHHHARSKGLLDSRLRGNERRWIGRHAKWTPHYPPSKNRFTLFRITR